MVTDPVSQISAVDGIEDQSGRTGITYVMGYGRSGSTLLDVILGSHPEITSVGEISYLSEWLAENKTCACHSPIQECEFWREVMSDYDRTSGAQDSLPREVERRVERRRILPRLLRGRISEPTTTRYREVQTALFESVARVADTRIVVDSSKSVHRTDGRPLALQRFTHFDVKVLHLVRDGRAVTWSGLKGPGASNTTGYRRHMAPFLRGMWVVMDWTITNLICLVLARQLRSGSVLRVRYEDLVRDPESELTRIGNFIGVDLAGVAEMISLGQPLSSGHNVGGNRMRFASEIRLKEDTEWRDRLPWTYRALYRLVAWPVARKLGY